MNEKQSITPRLMTIQQLGEYLQISPGTIRNRLSEGTFPIKAKRFGRAIRFDRQAVDKFLEAD